MSQANELLRSFAEAGPSNSTAGASSAGKPLPSSDPRQARLAAEALRRAHATGTAPYSRSHRKRLNRRARDQLGATGMEGVEQALGEVTAGSTGAEVPASEKITRTTGSGQMLGTGRKRTKAKSATKEGEGKKSKNGLTQKQRDAVLYAARLPRLQAYADHVLCRRRKAESVRLPAILKHPSFAANPFETIRLHAQNTVAMLSDNPSGGKRKPKS